MARKDDFTNLTNSTAACFRLVCLATLLTLSGVVFTGALDEGSAAHAQGAAGGDCEAVNLERTLSSLNTAVAVQGNRVIVTDPSAQQVVVFSQDGSVDEVSTRRLSSAFEDAGQHIIAGLKLGHQYLQFWQDPTNNAQGFMAQQFNDDFSRFNESAFSAGAFNKAESIDSFRLLSFFSGGATATTANKLFVYGVATTPGSDSSVQSYLRGFYVHEMTGGRGGSSLTELVYSHKESFNFFRIGYPYITSIGPVAYFLTLDVFPTLMRYDTATDTGPDYVTGFSGENERLPVFEPALRGAAEVFEEVEGFDIPAGLYSRDKVLYGLFRQPDGQGGTRWTLSQMNVGPYEVEEVRRFDLPSSAAHLTLAMSSDAVYVFEKSKVRQDGRQDVSKMLVIPASQLRGRNEQLCGELKKR